MKPAEPPKAVAKPKKKARPAARKVASVEPSNTFRGGARQDLRIPMDEDRRDELGDLVRNLNRRLRSRLPEAIAFRAMLTVMLSAEDAIFDAATASPIGRTPARQDTLAATEAERDVALVLADAMKKVDVRDLQRRYDEQLASLEASPEDAGLTGDAPRLAA